jgi:hypothetical protein
MRMQKELRTKKSIWQLRFRLSLLYAELVWHLEARGHHALDAEL